MFSNCYEYFLCFFAKQRISFIANLFYNNNKYLEQNLLPESDCRWYKPTFYYFRKKKMYVTYSIWSGLQSTHKLREELPPILCPKLFETFWWKFVFQCRNFYCLLSEWRSTGFQMMHLKVYRIGWLPTILFLETKWCQISKLYLM